MEKEKKSVVIPIALAVLLGIIFQAGFVWIESKDSPNKAVIEFTKAYFKLDPAMSERLCHTMQTVNHTNVVDQYIRHAVMEAAARGFDKNYMKQKLYHIETYTLSKSEDTARIRLTGKKRKSINPVFATVAQIFMIGESHDIDYTFQVVRESEKWKVCENPMALSI